MGVQNRFFDALEFAQSWSGNLSARDRMPFLCVVGYDDFAELMSAAQRDSSYSLPLNLPLPGDPEAEKSAGTGPINDPELDALQLIPKINPAWVEAGKVLHCDIPGLRPTLPDDRQLASQTEWFEFCGCKCFRSLCNPRGFSFA